MSKLLERLRKNTIIENASILKNSKYFTDDTFIPTDVPLLNLALSGRLKGGLPKSGVIQIAAPPKHFKSNFMIEIIKGFQNSNKGKDSITTLYDSELGTTPDYYEKSGVDTSLIDHRPIKSVEELKADAANLLNDIQEGDNVLVCIDSIGMLRSDKEAADALKNDVKTDMTRAKEIKSLFRIVTGEAAIKRIPLIVINHSYQTLEMYSKEVAGGGRGAQYAANTLLFITKAQETEQEEGKKVLTGFHFTLRAGLSRYVKENSTFPILVRFNEGIYKYSGFFDLALEFGFITAAKQGWYVVKGEDKQRRRSDIEEDEEFMQSLLDNEEFCAKVEEKYAL